MDFYSYAQAGVLCTARVALQYRSRSLPAPISFSCPTYQTKGWCAACSIVYDSHVPEKCLSARLRRGGLAVRLTASLEGHILSG